MIKRVQLINCSGREGAFVSMFANGWAGDLTYGTDPACTLRGYGGQVGRGWGIGDGRLTNHDHGLTNDECSRSCLLLDKSKACHAEGEVYGLMSFRLPLSRITPRA